MVYQQSAPSGGARSSKRPVRESGRRYPWTRQPGHNFRAGLAHGAGLRGRMVPLATAAACVLAATLGALLVLRPMGAPPRALPNTVVATVNGYPITGEELAIFIDSDRSAVLANFTRRFHLAVFGPASWTANFGGQVPADVLRSTALRQAESAKVQEEMMVASGIIANPSMAAFDREWQDENARRTASARAGVVIYGPIAYTKDEYYNYLFVNRVAELKQVLGRSQLAVSAATVKGFYEEHKAAMFTGPAEPTVSYMFVPMPKVIDGTRAELAHAAVAVRDGTSVMAAARAVPGANVEETTLNELNSQALFANDPTFAQVASTMTTGQVTGVITGQEGLYVAKCRSVKPGVVQSFGPLNSVVREDLVNVLYSQLVARRLASAVVHVDLPSLASVVVS